MISQTKNQPVLTSGYKRFRRQLVALRKHRIGEVVRLAAQARHELEQKRVQQASLLSMTTD